MPKVQFLISNFKFKIRKGYTLIEFLIVIGILSISIGSVLLFLTSVIKGTNQANISAEVKQNGQAVLEDLERQIRTATDIDSLVLTQLPSFYQINGSNGVKLNKSSGGYIYLICVNAVSGTSNGWIGVATNTTGSAPSNSTDYQTLTNQDLTSGVDINCAGVYTNAFQVNTVSSAVKVVTIGFTANQGVGAPSRVDFQANAKFQTVISLRQY